MNEWDFYLFSEYKSNAYKNENLKLYKGGSSPSKNIWNTKQNGLKMLKVLMTKLAK